MRSYEIHKRYTSINGHGVLFALVMSLIAPYVLGYPIHAPSPTVCSLKVSHSSCAPLRAATGCFLCGISGYYLETERRYQMTRCNWCNWQMLQPCTSFFIQHLPDASYCKSVYCKTHFLAPQVLFCIETIFISSFFTIILNCVCLFSITFNVCSFFFSLALIFQAL